MRSWAAAQLPPDLKCFVATLALCATLVYARSCGMLTGAAPKRAVD